MSKREQAEVAWASRCDTMPPCADTSESRTAAPTGGRAEPLVLMGWTTLCDPSSSLVALVPQCQLVPEAAPSMAASKAH